MRDVPRASWALVYHAIDLSSLSSPPHLPMKSHNGSTTTTCVLQRHMHTAPFSSAPLIFAPPTTNQHPHALPETNFINRKSTYFPRPPSYSPSASSSSSTPPSPSVSTCSSDRTRHLSHGLSISPIGVIAGICRRRFRRRERTTGGPVWWDELSAIRGVVWEGIVGGRLKRGWFGEEGLGSVMVNAHLRPVKPLWWGGWIRCCEKGIREAYRQREEAESRCMGAGGVVVSLSQWWIGSSCAGWEVLRWSLSA